MQNQTSFPDHGIVPLDKKTIITYSTITYKNYQKGDLMKRTIIKYIIYGTTVITIFILTTQHCIRYTMTQNTHQSTSYQTPSGLHIQITHKGDSSRPAAKAGDTVTVHYSGFLQNGTMFDSSHKRHKPFSFHLGAGKVIKGWDEGVAGMFIGEKRKLTIPSHLGYGARGAGYVIPPNATLIFDVELLAIT